MRIRLKRCVWISLLAFALLGLAGCSGTPDVNGQSLPPGPSEGSQSTGERPGQASQAATPATGSFDCAGADPHPIGQSIAATYEVSYEQVMRWFCEGYSFENILIALETGEAVEIPAETLLQMLQEKEWEEIWAEVGFTDEQ